VSDYHYLDVLRCAAPETILALTALTVLFVDLSGMRSVDQRYRRLVAAALTAVGCVAGLFWTVFASGEGQLPAGILVVDPLSQFTRQVILVLTLLAVGLAAGSELGNHIGEFFCLLVLAVIGMMLMAGAENLLMIFVAVELSSLSLYVLTAFNKSSAPGSEAALKYFLFGGVAAAFLLFGFSLLYGLTGTVELRLLAGSLADGADPLILVAMVMVAIGLGFKIAAVPFHLWAPDAYQAAPLPAAVLIATGSKVAAFCLLAKVMVFGLAGLGGSGAWRAMQPGWISLLAFLAVFSMIFGNLAALAQSSVKRLLAYSAVAHAGYALLGVAADSSSGVAALMYYVSTYSLATLGAFGFLILVEGQRGDTSLADLRGLGRKAPFASLCMMIFLLSLAGIPPLAGFFGKFYVFAAILEGTPEGWGNLWLVIVGVIMSTVSLYYYLQVLKSLFVEGNDDTVDAGPFSPLTQVVLGIAAFGVVLFGCAPDLLLRLLPSDLALLGW